MDPEPNAEQEAAPAAQEEASANEPAPQVCAPPIRDSGVLMFWQFVEMVL